jgi:hypothetical protein
MTPRSFLSSASVICIIRGKVIHGQMISDMISMIDNQMFKRLAVGALDICS